MPQAAVEQTDVSVPFVDLGRANRPVAREVVADARELLESGAFTNGPRVAAFEERFAEYCGAGICVGLASGLDALRLALLAAGIEDGDEVVVPAMTFAATFEAVIQAGGTPVVADIDPVDYTLDPSAAEAATGPRTRFLLPVHLYGQMADVRSLERVARRHGLRIVEDACQAHGAEREGIRAGTAGLAGAFSFYPTKNLGAAGDAGAVVTDDDALAREVRALREHGEVEKHRSVRPGYTARLDAVQAIVLLHKLGRLDEWNADRRRAAGHYTEALAGVGDLDLPTAVTGASHVWHLYVVRTANPNALARHLAERGIQTGRHYPEPPHRAQAYDYLGYEWGSFPVAEALAREALSLPLFPGITQDELEAVVAAIEDFFDRG